MSGTYGTVRYIRDETIHTAIYAHLNITATSPDNLVLILVLVLCYFSPSLPISAVLLSFPLPPSASAPLFLLPLHCRFSDLRSGVLFDLG